MQAIKPYERVVGTDPTSVLYHLRHPVPFVLRPVKCADGSTLRYSSTSRTVAHGTWAMFVLVAICTIGLGFACFFPVPIYTTTYVAYHFAGGVAVAFLLGYLALVETFCGNELVWDLRTDSASLIRRSLKRGREVLVTGTTDRTQCVWHPVTVNVGGRYNIPWSGYLLAVYAGDYWVPIACVRTEQALQKAIHDAPEVVQRVYRGEGSPLKCEAGVNVTLGNLLNVLRRSTANKRRRESSSTSLTSLARRSRSSWPQTPGS